MAVQQDDHEIFRYLRVGSGVRKSLLDRGAFATCSKVHDKCIVLGFSDGEVVVAAPRGNVACRWRAHATSVTVRNRIAPCAPTNTY